MLDDLHALVEFAQAGSIAGAADRLFRTPSAITRQLQRLEAALGARGCRGLLGVKNGLTWRVVISPAGPLAFERHFRCCDESTTAVSRL